MKLSIGACIDGLYEYVDNHKTQTLLNYRKSLDPIDREHCYKPFTRTLIIRVVYLILGLDVPALIARVPDNMELVDQLRSEWEEALTKEYCENLRNKKQDLINELDWYCMESAIANFGLQKSSNIQQEAFDIPCDYCPGCGEEEYACCCDRCDACNAINPEGSRHRYCRKDCKDYILYSEDKLVYLD